MEAEHAEVGVNTGELDVNMYISHLYSLAEIHVVLVFLLRYRRSDILDGTQSTKGLLARIDCSSQFYAKTT